MIGRRNPRRQIVVTALATDRRVLCQWELDLDHGQRVSVPEGTRTVHINDPSVDERVRVELGSPRRRSGQAVRRRNWLRFPPRRRS